jgi:hypothetical protein
VLLGLRGGGSAFPETGERACRRTALMANVTYFPATGERERCATRPLRLVAAPSLTGCLDFGCGGGCQFTQAGIHWLLGNCHCTAKKLIAFLKTWLIRPCF